LKDFLRRNAREERDMFKAAEMNEEIRKTDMEVIERCRFEKIPIPEKLRKKYGDELTEVNYGVQKNMTEKDRKELSKPDRVRLQLLNQKKLAEKKKVDFAAQFIKDDKDEGEFKRKLLLFVSLRKRCFNCKYFEDKLDMDSMLVICPILRKPICHQCKHSDAFKMTSATSASRKYKVEKKDIDMLALGFIDAPNPYYPALKMKLYYEFMIVENLPRVKAWRKFKKEKQQSLLKEHHKDVRQAKEDAKTHKVLFALEIEFKRHGREISRD